MMNNKCDVYVSRSLPQTHLVIHYYNRDCKHKYEQAGNFIKPQGQVQGYYTQWGLQSVAIYKEAQRKPISGKKSVIIFSEK